MSDNENLRRTDALSFFPPHLTASLLAMPVDARRELTDFLDSVLRMLVEVRENDYAIPKAAGGHIDFDDAVAGLQLMVALLDGQTEAESLGGEE